MNIQKQFHVVCDRIRSSQMTISGNSRNGYHNRGFTLVEVIMVMAIILALSLMVIPMYTQVVSRARVARSVGEIRTIEKAINAYYLDNGNQYPPNLTAVGYGALLDPWGNPYVYHKVPAYVDIDTLPLNTDYDLYSQGEDGASGEDLMNFPNCLNDVIRAGNGAIVELARNH